ncbi:MAG TPA: alpha/beta fold hydrolase [Thermoanaerobaculia bacterium]|nr:alpha/beta fold hydrolase [Thermoanaerobaculia bacterium]
MHRFSIATLAFLLTASTAEAAPEEDVRYQSDVSLAAALLLPERTGPSPAAVIVQGSGSSDRTNAWARSIADLFVARGVAVLLTDKRGSGQSGGDWKVAGFDELAKDAAAGVDYLKSRKEVDSRRIGLIGLSQGGWIVPMAAVRRPDVAFVVNLSGATVSFAEQSFLEMRNTARQAGLSADGVNQIIELNKAAGRYILGGSWDDYAAMRAAAMKGAAKPVAAGFPDSKAAPAWTFLRKVGAHDPTAYWSMVEQPVFIGLGERDEEDNVPVGESVRRVEHAFGATGKKNYDVVVAPGAGHALWNEKREFAPLLIERLDAWLKQYVKN